MREATRDVGRVHDKSCVPHPLGSHAEKSYDESRLHAQLVQPNFNVLALLRRSSSGRFRQQAETRRHRSEDDHARSAHEQFRASGHGGRASHLLYTRAGGGSGKPEAGSELPQRQLKISKSAKGVETSSLTVLASFSSQEPSKKGFPAGMLGVLTLRISEKAHHGMINLRTVAEASELGSTEPLKNVRTSNAHVEVAWVDAPPSISCFFFSH
jgi:hypothetical protein